MVGRQAKPFLLGLGGLIFSRAFAVKTSKGLFSWPFVPWISLPYVEDLGLRISKNGCVFFLELGITKSSKILQIPRHFGGSLWKKTCPDAPWDWYTWYTIYIHFWIKLMVNPCIPYTYRKTNGWKLQIQVWKMTWPWFKVVLLGGSSQLVNR